MPKQLFNIFMGAAFTFKFVRTQSFNRLKPLYILPHKQLVDSGKP